MKYDRDFLVDVHNDIKADMCAMRLEPHCRHQNLISHFTYGCDFYTLRYWSSKDTELLRLTAHWYNQSCLELLVCDNSLYIGIWFSLNNKDFLKLKKHERDIIEKREEYPEFKWIDEKGTPAGENLIQWLCESDHETVFRKELTDYNRDEVITEIKHLREYLDILL